MDEVYVEFAKFATHSALWWKGALEDPNTTPTIFKNDIIESLNLHRVDRWPATNFAIEDSDLDRYQAAHAALAEKIALDARARKLWYARNCRGPKLSA